MTQQTKTYRERSREYLAKAFRELEAGDLTQASEKGWGAAAQIVKAVADERGMDHRSHRNILVAAQSFARETADISVQEAFDYAQSLHGNFYEDIFIYGEVEWRLQRVARFVERLERLLPSG